MNPPQRTDVIEADRSAASHWPLGMLWIADRYDLGALATDVHGERDDGRRPRIDLHPQLGQRVEHV